MCHIICSFFMYNQFENSPVCINDRDAGLVGSQVYGHLNKIGTIGPADMPTLLREISQGPTPR